MSDFFDPFDADKPLMMRCSCGKNHTPAEHSAEQSFSAVAELTRRSQGADFQAYSDAFIEATLVKALFPQDAQRRRFIKAVNRTSAPR